MNYFRRYPIRIDIDTVAALESQIPEILKIPWLAQELGKRRSELFPLFVTSYRNLRALPRGARRALQRRLARSGELKGLIEEQCQHEDGQALHLKLARSIAGAALLLALWQGICQAATITVNTNVAGILSDGKCSFVEAIINANNDTATHGDCSAGSGADVIVLPTKSSIRLTGIQDNTYGATSLPAISSAITVEGSNSKISRNKSKSDSRLIAVTSTGDLTLENVTVSGGLQYNGGGLFNAGTLTITNSTVSGNGAVFGGGIFNAAGGTLSIQNSTISKNAAIYGGGIADYSGILTVTNSTISGNKAHMYGGGIYTRAGSVTIGDSSNITGNRAVLGGALFARGGTLTTDNITISKNRSSNHGGGVWMTNGAAVTIQNSTIAGNRSHYSGGGVVNQGGNLIIENSTISGNKSGTDAGGIMHLFGTLTIENSTISGNRSKYGGGIWHQDIGAGATTVINSTISGNKGKRGGGIYNSRDELTLSRSVVSGNIAGLGTEIFNLTSNSATIVADDFNLFGTNGNAGVIGFTPGTSDIIPAVGVNVSGIMAPLADNGGPTPTHALVTGSPALDVVPGSDPGCTGTDQRGVARPQGPHCDIGAFERE